MLFKEHEFSPPLTVTITATSADCPPPEVTVMVRRTTVPVGYLSTAMAISGPGPPEHTTNSQSVSPHPQRATHSPLLDRCRRSSCIGEGPWCRPLKWNSPQSAPRHQGSTTQSVVVLQWTIVITAASNSQSSRPVSRRDESETLTVCPSVSRTVTVKSYSPGG